LAISNAADKEGKLYKHAELSPEGRRYLINASAVKREVVARARPSLVEEDGDVE
jgi:hypothetical protein